MAVSGRPRDASESGDFGASHGLRSAAVAASRHGVPDPPKSRPFMGWHGPVTPPPVKGWDGVGWGESARWPISRVLCPGPDGPGDDHSSGTPVARTPRATNPSDGAETRLTPFHPKRDGWSGRSYSVLLPVGFTVPPPLPGSRCALTAPFHPYRRRTVGGLLSVALSLGSPPPVVNRHRVSVEPGLSSPGRNRRRSSSHLARLFL